MLGSDGMSRTEPDPHSRREVCDEVLAEPREARRCEQSLAQL